MTYEVYHSIFVGTAICAVIFLIITIILFFVFRIPSVIGILSGATERKAIRAIQAESKQESGGEASAYTEKISTQKLTDGQSDSMSGNETVLLGSGQNETTLLNEHMFVTGNCTERLSVSNEVQEIFHIEQEITFIHTDEIIHA